MRKRERETVSEEERERVPFSSTSVHFISSCQDFSIFYGKVSSFFGGGNHTLVRDWTQVKSYIKVGREPWSSGYGR